MRSNQGKRLTLILAFLMFLLVAGCATTHDRLLDMDTSQVQLRSIQTRAFDTIDKEKTMRAVIATLQDLAFIIDRADLTLGVLSATKLGSVQSGMPTSYMIRVTVAVRPRGDTQLIVRVNAEHGLKPVTDPKPYQNFFAALERAMFLEAHQVD
jgi:hypothetical protein